MAKILIVDDDKNNRQLYVALLTPFGHQVIEASDGKDGLEQARLGKPDLIISDILMPTMSGYEFVSALRKSPTLESVPVIFSSATFLDRETRSLGAACNVSLFIMKPCEPEKALAIVQEALGLEMQRPTAPPPIQAVRLDSVKRPVVHSGGQPLHKKYAAGSAVYYEKRMLGASGPQTNQCGKAFLPGGRPDLVRQKLQRRRVYQGGERQVLAELARDTHE